MSEERTPYVAGQAETPAEPTPGPWEVYGATLVWSPTAEATIASASELRATGYLEYREPKRHSGNRAEFSEICANARLMAAAPELLAELKHIVALIDVSRPRFMTLDHARAVIAKAEGRTP